MLNCLSIFTNYIKIEKKYILNIYIYKELLQKISLVRCTVALKVIRMY